MIKTRIFFLSMSFASFCLMAQPGNPMPDHDIEKQFDAIIKVESGSKNLKNETITSNEDGKNAVFVRGEKSLVNAEKIKIRTKKNGSRGLYAAFGGTIKAKNVDVETLGEHCAAFATDMGEGTVTVDGGNAVTKGKGSPVIYSTGDITVKNLNGEALNSEIAVIEGKNSVLIEKSKISGGSGLDGEVSAGIMLYQSMSGDANEGTAFFTAKNSELTNRAAGENSVFFYVTNTKAVVNLDSVKLLGNSDVLLRVSGNNSERGWGRRGANGGQLEFNAFNENLSGQIIVDEISSLSINLGKKSSFTGAVNSKKTGKADITISKDAKLNLTADSYFNKFSDEDDTFKNIKSNGFIIYYNKNNTENSALKGRTILLADGGKIAPAEYDFTALEKSLSEQEKGDFKMKKPEMGKMGGPKMELETLKGTLNVIKNKAMLISDDNKATLLSVMEGPKNGGKNSGQPPKNGGKRGEMPPADMDERNPPPMMRSGSDSGKNRPKPVSFDDLKKLTGKKVEVQGITEKDGTFRVFSIKEAAGK